MQPVTSPPPTLDDILRSFQETDRIIKESQKETNRRFEETERILKQTSLEVKAVSANIGKLGNRLGEFVEEAVRPSAVRLFRACGIEVHEVQQNIVVNRNGESMELDLLVVNDKDAVAIECKSHLSIDDVNEHLARLDKIKCLLPRYKDNRVLGAVAGMIIPENVALYAIRKGLYVIGQNGDHLELRNEAVFVPKAW
jgi:hypothetical protein